VKPLSLALVALLAASAFAEGRGPKKLERDGFAVEIPAGWGELPEVANNTKNAFLGASTDVDGGAVAFGDPKVGVMAVVFWVEFRDKVPDVRAALEGFHDEIKRGLQENGTSLTSFALSETNTVMTASLAGSDGSVTLKGRTAAAVGKDARLGGWTVRCMFADAAKKKAAPVCEALVVSFKVTVPEMELQPIPPKKRSP
jgi:hypothetical protein